VRRKKNTFSEKKTILLRSRIAIVSVSRCVIDVAD